MASSASAPDVRDFMPARRRFGLDPVGSPDSSRNPSPSGSVLTRMLKIVSSTPISASVIGVCAGRVQPGRPRSISSTQPPSSGCCARKSHQSMRHAPFAATDKQHLLRLLRQLVGNIPPARGALDCVCRVIQVVHPLLLLRVGVGNVFVCHSAWVRSRPTSTSTGPCAIGVFRSSVSFRRKAGFVRVGQTMPPCCISTPPLLSANGQRALTSATPSRQNTSTPLGRCCCPVFILPARPA